MAYVSWPSTLQQLVDQDSFAYGFGDTTLRSANSNGPDKVRRKMTKGTDTMTFSFVMPRSQYFTLASFYQTTTNGGVNQFYFMHPITQAQVLLRFTKPPGITPIGGLVFKVSIEAEILPQ